MSELESVRSIPIPEPTPSISIEFSPHKEAYRFIAGEITFEPANTYYANSHELVTFTATAVFPTSDRHAVSYRWRFGDGREGSGNPVTHTYEQATINLSVACTVTDNYGKQWMARKSMYLKETTIQMSEIIPPTDTMLHASAPGDLTAIPWHTGTGGSFSETEGWNPGNYSETSPKANTRNGWYWNVEKLTKGTGFTSIRSGVGIGGPTGVNRSFAVWIFSAMSTEPSGYQVIILGEATPNYGTVILRKWVGGTVTVLQEVAGVEFAATGELAVKVRSGRVSAWVRSSKSDRYALQGTEHIDSTFTEGYSGVGGNGTNALTNFTTSIAGT